MELLRRHCPSETQSKADTGIPEAQKDAKKVKNKTDFIFVTLGIRGNEANLDKLRDADVGHSYLKHLNVYSSRVCIYSI